MKTSSCKAKGRLLQQMVRDKLLAKFPVALTKDDVRSTGMGQQGEDIQLSATARCHIPFRIECKSRARFAIYEDYDQAASHGSGVPLVVIKSNRREPLAVLSLDHLLELL